MSKFLKSKKFIVVLIIALAVGLFFFFRQRSRVNGQNIPQFSAQKDEVVTPQVRDLDEIITLAGKIDATSKSEVRFETSGRLAWVGVKVGDKVKKWQTLASLDKTELKKSLEKQFNDYKSQLDTFQDTQNEYKTIKENNNLTDEMRHILNRSQNGLNNSVIAYELADLSIKYANIWSPINGVVTGVDQPNPGINVTPATSAFFIVDPNSLYFRSEIDEEDVTKISLGQKTQIKIDSFPDKSFASEVTYIGFNPVSGQSSTVYEVRFKLDLDNQDLKYRLGMNGDADILISQAPQALSVPLEAVSQDAQGQNFVYLKTSQNRLEKRSVKVGVETDSYIQILEGISENDQVVIKKS